MLPSLVRGAVLAGAAGLVAALPSTLGLSSPWPVLLVAAVALARPFRPGAVGAVLVGAASWWLAIALRAGVLADTTSALVISAMVAVGLCTVVATATRERLPLWAALVGIAAFAGIYEPMFADAPTRFLTESALALASVVVAAGLGSLAAVLATSLGDTAGAARRAPRSAPAGEVA